MKQSEKSKVWMEEALLQLMKTKDFSEITIKDITERAGVSRLTFYRNYDNKEHILVHHISAGFSEYMDTLKQYPRLDLRQAIICCFQFWSERSEEIRLLIKQQLSLLLFEPFESCLHEVMRQIELDSNFSFFQRQFIIGGMFSEMIAWIDNPHGYTPEDITDEILDLISQSKI